MTITKPVYMTPPADMLQSCLPLTHFNVSTNADSISYSNWLESMLEQCEQRIESIKQWAAQSGSQ
ncbi:Rz1-like lysis system protein LysC [Rheinheimera salexigens]